MYLTLFLIIFTSIISYKGIKDSSFQQRFSFNVKKVRVKKEYIRMISSGFLHVSWMHLIINMFVLFGFGSGLEVAKGVFPFLAIYISSLIGGNVFALLIHKHDPRYSSVGASGAISGLVFATIALFPQTQILFLPSWVFGIAYIGFTLYAIRSQRTDVGHAAHLGGALIGMIVALLMSPQDLIRNWMPILAVLVPAVALILIIIYKPNLILISKRSQKEQLTIEDQYNMDRKQRQQEIDRILEKINQTGMSSLSRKEKQMLEEYSRS